MFKTVCISNPGCFLFLCLLVAPLLSPAQYLNWAFGLDGGILDEKGMVTLDPQGNLMVIGQLVNVDDLDPGPDTSDVKGPSLIRYSTAGDYISAMSMMTTQPMGIAMPGWTVFDNSGNLYLAGGVAYSFDFDPDTGTAILSDSTGALYIAKYDATGNYVFARNFDETYNCGISEMGIDGAGNIYLAGNNYDTVNIDPGPGTHYLFSGDSTDGMYVAKYDGATGNLLWANSIVSGFSHQIKGLAVDDLGNSYITGYFRDSADFDPGPGIQKLYSAGYDDIFIASYDSSGNYRWAIGMGSASPMLLDGRDWGSSIILDRDGNVCITGFFDGSVDFDPGPDSAILNHSGFVHNMYLAKYDNAGNYLWAVKWAQGIGGSGYELAVDDSNNLYVLANFSNPGFINVSGVAKYNSSGVYLWHREMPGADPVNMVVDAMNNFYLAGTFYGTVDFDLNVGSHELTAIKEGDFFLAAYRQDFCSPVDLRVVSYSDIDCSGPGFMEVEMYGGTEPYSYSWNTIPPSDSTALAFTQPGIYTITGTDSNACSVAHSFLVNAPGSSTGYDLDVTLSSYGFRQYFISGVQAEVFNDGCSQVSGSLKVVLDTLVGFLGADPAPDLISGDTLIWNFYNINYDSARLAPLIYATIDTTAAIGDSVLLAAIVTPLSGDLDTSNNIRYYKFPVVNSFDPNDKQASPQDETAPGETLTYTIRFQNTGNAPAINVFIIDTLDANLELQSVKVTGTSHAMHTEAHRTATHTSPSPRDRIAAR